MLQTRLQGEVVSKRADFIGVNAVTGNELTHCTMNPTRQCEHQFHALRVSFGKEQYNESKSAAAFIRVVVAQ